MNIAIVKLSSLGDVIHALPVAHALRAAFPRGRLTWLVEARESAVLRDHPDLDAVVSVDTRRWRRLLRSPRGAIAVTRELGRLWARFRRERFDAVLDLQGLLKSGLLTALSGASLRIGFVSSCCREPMSAVFTNRRVRPARARRHAVEQYLALLEPLGVHVDTPVFSIPIRPAAEASIDDFFAAWGLKPRDRVVALNPGAARAEKRWPVPHFRALAERLHAETGARILVVWGPDELPAARAIQSGLTAARTLLAPPTDLDELGALFRRCSLVVAGDTGPLHLAAALGTPAIGLYGPTRAERNGPYGPSGRAVQSEDQTMDAITPDAVFRLAAPFLA
jgi:heptosyltransferase I